MDDAKTHREKLFNEHVVDKFLTRISEKSAYLEDLYQDKSGQVQTLQQKKKNAKTNTTI